MNPLSIPTLVLLAFSFRQGFNGDPNTWRTVLALLVVSCGQIIIQEIRKLRR